MAKIAGPGVGRRSGLYDELYQRERDKHARRGRVECGDGAVFCRPHDTLDRFEAGKPVEFDDWQIPRWARSGRVSGARFRVHSDGRVAELDE